MNVTMHSINPKVFKISFKPERKLIMSLISNFIKPIDAAVTNSSPIWCGKDLQASASLKRQKNGEIFPAFQFISVTNDCNLRCQGCWVSTNGKTESLDVERIHSIIEESKKQGSYFFGILGGEPLNIQTIIRNIRKTS